LPVHRAAQVLDGFPGWRQTRRGRP
jgi:hypothetical protein